MKTPSKLILLAFASLTIPAYAVPPTVITSLPFSITVPGKYVLNQSLTSPDIAAILITCGDVTVDLNGYTITGRGETAYKAFGIEIYNPNVVSGALSNIIIENGTLNNFRTGIIFTRDTGASETNSIVRDVTMSAVGVAIADTAGTCNHIERCTIVPDANAQIGIELLNCTGDVISGNKFYPSSPPYQDILIQGTVEGNVVVSNKDD
jgi:hypothetical protein